MLVLTRKEGESIDIGNDIVVKVSAIKGDKVLVGVQAPTSVGILRSEVRERLAAAGATPRNTRLASMAAASFGVTFAVEVEAPCVTKPGEWTWRVHRDGLTLSDAHGEFKQVQAEAGIRDKGTRWGIVKTWRAVRVVRHGKDGKTITDAARLDEPAAARDGSPAVWLSE